MHARRDGGHFCCAEIQKGTILEQGITCAMKRNPFDPTTLDEIFKFDPGNGQRLASRESGKLEFKEAFHLGSVDDYAKTVAAFANTAGGYLVYGVKDKPRTIIGLKTDAFDSIDPAKLTQSLNALLAPEIQWDISSHQVQGKKLGIIYVHEAKNKPVLCLKTTKEVHEGAIYYRYRGRSEKIKYPELRQLLDSERQKERQLWAHTLQRMGRIGIENVGLLNSATGEITGSNGSFLISEDLLPQIQFIHQGTFVEAGGQPTLKLIGEALPINSQLVQPTKFVRTPLHAADVIRAFVRRESVLTPLDYIKQICFEASQFYPVYFFINQTSMTISDVIAEIGKVDCRPAGKAKLIGRLKKDEALTCGSMNPNTDTGKQVSAIYSDLISKSLVVTECQSHPREFFYALTHLTKENADPEFILPLIHGTVFPRFSSLKSLDATFMRKAICHLDLVWYKQGTSRKLSVAATAGMR